MNKTIENIGEQEIDKMKEKLEDSDINEALKLAEGMTDESLGELKEEIEEFLEEKEEETEKSGDDTDPFTALFKSGKKKEEKEEEITKKSKKIKSDNYLEKTVRNLAVKESKRTCFNLFDVYKKTHGMMSHPDPFAEIFIPDED